MAIKIETTTFNASNQPKPETGSKSLLDRISSVWKTLCLGLSNDTLSAAGSLNGTTSGVEALATAIDAKADTSLAADSSDANTGAFTVSGGANGLIFAIQNIFKGIFFAKEGASTGDSTRLGIGSARVVRGTLDSFRNAANISKGGILLSSGAEAFKDVLAKISIGAAAGSAATGLIVSATGYFMAKEVFTEAKEFDAIVENKDPSKTRDQINNEAFQHLKDKLKVSDNDIQQLKSEIEGKSTGVLSRLGRFLRYVFRDAKTEFVLLCREVIRSGKLDPKTKLKLEQLKRKINETPVTQEAFHSLNDIGDKLDEFKELYLKIESEQLQEKKTKLFDRVFGKDVRELLEANENPKEVTKAEIVSKAKANVTSNKRLFTALKWFAFIGTIASLTFAILDYLETFTGMPIMKIVETSILLVTTLLMLGIDIAFLLKSTAGKSDRANKIAAIGTLMLSWATQTALLITFKLSMIKAQVLVPLSLIGAGMIYLIRKVAAADTEKQPEQPRDSGIGEEQALLASREA